MSPNFASRREFLLSAAGAAVAAASLSFPKLSNLPWSELGRSLSGSLIRPRQNGYERLASSNNLRYRSVLPAGIALCADAKDVSTAILWGRKYGVPLVARSGGHSYAGYSTTTGLLIDVTMMRSFAFDRRTGTATLGGGSRNAEVFTNLPSLGVAITHGRCPGVGVAGLVLGGGIGFNMRRHGLTCDQLVETEMVASDGAVLRINATENSDLYWACRGAGGGNYGINTSFAFQTFPVGSLTVYNLTWDERPQEVFAALVAALERAPSAVGCKVTAEVKAGGQRKIQIQLIGQFAGTKAKLLEILQPAYAVATSSGSIVETAYWQGQRLIGEAGEPAYYHERSRFFNQSFGDRAVATVFEWMGKQPGELPSRRFSLFQTGMRVNAVAPSATAFVHRTSHWLSTVALTWEEATPAAMVESNLAWQTNFHAAIVPIAKGGAYQNFIDPALESWKTAYYGANLPRLESMKRRIDPDRVFNFPEAIPPS
jgi:FAD/FMN-containing dehydrogenase